MFTSSLLFSSPLHLLPRSGMNQYVGAVKEKVTSGEAMMAFSDGDLEKKLGISNPLHRRKLRLAITEQRAPHM